MKRILTALLLSIPAAAKAQQTDTTVFRVGEIIAQAARPLATTGGASAIEIRIDSLRMRAAPTLDQLLRQVPLVQVRVNSRGESQFSLRGFGSDARQVAVVVDGIPLNFGWDDRADLSVLPTTAARSLTVARGLPSLLYGPNILGGVVEIGVARGGPDLSVSGLRADAGVDNTGATGVSAALTHPFRSASAGWLLRAGVGHRQRDNFPFAGDSADGPDDTRLNTDLNHVDGFASLSYRKPGGGWADASVSAYKAERGIAPEMHVGAPRFWRYPEMSRAFAVIAAGTGHQKSFLGGVGDIELSIGADVAHTEIDQYSDNTFTTIASEEDSDDKNLTVRLRADQTVGSSSELRAGFTYTDINHAEVLNPGIASEYQQRLWSAGLELHVQPTSRMRWTGGVAIDGGETPKSGDKPSLEPLTAWGARAGLTSPISDAVILHAGASARSRFPSLRELYSDALGRFEPNPNLAAERLLAFEAGASWSGRTADLQAVAFHHVLDDAIVRVAVPGTGRFQRVNRDRQVGTGVELLTGMRVNEFSLSGDLVVQRTTLEDESTGASSQPEYQPDLLAGVGLAGPIPLHARFDLRGRYTGKQSCINPDSGSEVGLDPSTRVDAEVSRSWRIRRGTMSVLELAIGGDNLGDTAIYDQCGLPQPGRTFRVQLRVR